MERVSVYLPKTQLDALRAVAAGSGRSIAALIREAIRASVLKAAPVGPVAIWDGVPKGTSVEHD